MADLLHVAARLRALENGQAVPIVSQRQVVIQPHAKILTLISMAGEDTSVHAAAYGRVGEPAQVFVIVDPRRRDDQNALLRELLPLFEAYYAQCRADGTFPQIWVSSAGALGHLDTLADRLSDDGRVRDVTPADIGVVCAHVSQVNAVRERLGPGLSDVFVETANRFKASSGPSCSCIIRCRDAPTPRPFTSTPGGSA
ncbi:hypothetical protein [uncultured Methylobacterium sp.]|uniref:hypothetical protein n=1 Tax=uncultured Methylobacterium sp. TaxID=157278 RepID=UPI0035CA2802